MAAPGSGSPLENAGRIESVMNKMHADSLLAIARHYAGAPPAASSARIVPGRRATTFETVLLYIYLCRERERVIYVVTFDGLFANGAEGVTGRRPHKL